MGADTELVLVFGSLHLVAIAFGALLFVMFVRSEPVEEWHPPESDDGGGGGNVPPHEPDPRSPFGGGLELPGETVPSRERFRGPGRLADRHEKPRRRPDHEPQRTPVPQREHR